MKLTALGGGSEPVFVDFIKDGQTVTLLTETIDMSKAARATITLDLPPELFGTLELCAYRFNDEGLPVRKSRVVYVSAGQRSEHQGRRWTGPIIGPASTARLNFTLTDSEGKPRRGDQPGGRGRGRLRGAGRRRRAWNRPSTRWSRSC